MASLVRSAKYLEKASKLTDIPVIIQWKPFYLNETTPAEGMALSDYIDMKYGAGAYKSFQPRFHSMKKMGEQVGIMFTDDRKIYATTKAHVLMEIINSNVGLNEQDPSIGNNVMNQLFQFYFEQGGDINNTDKLLECLMKAGYTGDIGQIRSTLDSAYVELSNKVKEQDRHAKSVLRVNGVPHFLFHSNQKGVKPVGISGAQPPDVLAEILTDISSS